MNYITDTSHVRVTQIKYTRIDIDGSDAMGFDMSHRVEHELSAEQVAKLGSLLRGSWYTRSFRSQITYRVPPDVDSYYQYSILISNGVEFANLHFTWGGHVLRSGNHYRNYNDWFRIRTSGWEEVLLEILSGEDV